MSDHVTQLRLEEAATGVRETLAPDPLIVRLNKVFSWQQSASRWPYYLSRAMPGRAYTKEELVEQVFADDQRGHQAPHEKGWLSSIYSIKVDREFAEVRIEGLGLFARTDAEPDKFTITGDGLELARAYSADRASTNWKRIFAAILARNDVRMRSVLLHIGRRGSFLTFRDGASADAFFAPHSGGALREPDGCELQLFEYSKGADPAYSFTPVLRDDPYIALGPFLRGRIETAGVRVPANIRLEGGRDTFKARSEPSGNNLRDYMKQALSLFRDIGALVYVPHRQGWTLDRERCAALFEPDLVRDLFGGAPERRFLDALRAAYTKYSDDGGLVHVATVRDAVCDELDIAPGERVAYFNQQVAYYMRPDVARLSIGRTFHAQAAPQDCLFGDLRQEYVEFRFIE